MAGRRGSNLLLHGVVPVLGILAFVPAWFTALGIGKGVFDWVSPLPYPLNRDGLVVGIWFALGQSVPGGADRAIRAGSR